MISVIGGGGVIGEIACGQSGAGEVANAVGIGTLEVPTEFDRVASLDPGEVLRPVPGLVGRRGDGIALHAADVATIAEMVEVNVGHTEVGRAQRTGVNAQALRIDLVIYAENLGETCKAKTALQKFVRPYIPSPTRTRHLRAGRGYRVEQSWVVSGRGQTSKRRPILKTIP